MNSLIKYDAMRYAVEVCRDIDEAKDISDKAKALEIYARQAHDPELEIWVAEIRLRARRKVGELSSALETAQGANQHRSSAGTKREALTTAGISKAEAHRCELIWRVPRDAFETYIATQSASKKAVTADEIVRMVVKRERKQTVAAVGDAASIKTADLSFLSSRGMKFGTVYADPPWLYGNQSTRGATEDHYVGMTVDEICSLPVAGLVADSAHLHLWTTNAFLFEAKRVMEAWGFEYRSCYIWVKPQMGMGNYWRVSHEFMLFGIKGRASFSDRSLMSWGQYPRGKHSAKPEPIRGLIERASPGPYLEMFARRPARGWTVWGNEVACDVLNESEELTS